ncbi:MAG: hypothetical protein J1F40_08265 [Prevotellaceae bacterium]|nr:hypothetical protein [Prevotellaceae bacterium]
MKKTSILALAALTLASCTGGAPTEGGAEALALYHVKSSLGRTAEVIDHQTLTAHLPPAVKADAFKGYRDAVNKARLDYSTSQVRGIQMGMDKALATIETCQTDIAAITRTMAQNDTTTHLIILATLKEKSGATSHLIAAFSPSTLEPELWLPVTTPVQNNAALIANAQHGTLLTPAAMTASQNLDSLATTVDDPVVQFILRSNPK